MPPTTYSNLGFDPCPGSPESVSTLQQRISTAATSTRQANDLMQRLRNDKSGIWRGPTGEAFRYHLDLILIDDLGKANQSLNKAVSALKAWGERLTGFKQRADALERQAAQAQQKLTAAQEKQHQAANNPDLKLAGQRFATETELRNAQQRLDSATLALRNANSDVDAAEDALKGIRKKAHDLHDEWDETATKTAGKIREAAEFAPHKPGWLSRIGNSLGAAAAAVGDWAKEHLDDIHMVLSTISAIAGLVALCTPPPVDAVALAICVVAGVGALGCTLADSKVRKDLGEMLHGDFSGNWGSALQLGGDVIGLIPGGVFVKEAAPAVRAGELFAEGTRGFPRIVDLASSAAHEPGWVANKVVEYGPHVGPTLEKLKLLEPTMGNRPEAAADMVNFLIKSAGSAKKTVETAWNGVSGGIGD